MSTAPIQSQIDAMMAATFHAECDPRIEEYKAGVRAHLMMRLTKNQISFPYELGTASADAYFAGIDDGFVVWERYAQSSKDMA